MLEYPNGCKDKLSPRKNQELDRENALSSSIQLSSLYESSSICIERVEKINGQFHLYGRSSLKYGVCPYCGSISKRIHSRYFRTIRDLSIIGFGVTIHFLARKYFCEEKNCQHKTFAEQPGNEVFKYRRRTRRCEVFVAQQSSSCSSNTARKLLTAMKIPISSSTVLRDLHRIAVPDVHSVRKVGVDDWAFRKGVTYGSLIINLENGSFLALLGDREQDSFKSWLIQHPNIDTVSRDRSSDYSAAISSTQRDITEIADRFHLIKNFSEKISKLMNERYSDYKSLVRPEALKLPSMKSDKKTILLPVSKRKDKRQVHFNLVKDLRSKGLTIKKISQTAGISIPTVIKYIHLDSLPERGHTARNKYHLYEERVSKEYLELGISLHNIWKRLISEGVKFGKTPFYDHFEYLKEVKRGLSEEEKEDNTRLERLLEETKRPLLPPIAMSFIVDKFIRKKELKAEEEDFISTMCKLPWFIEICAAAREFYDIVKTSCIERLRSWILRYEKSSITYIKSFIYGLKHDMSAVENALRYPISNGILEGHVNKLKTIKRTMYGRAGINLLAIKMYLAEDVLFN